MMDANQLRSTFTGFYAERGHTVVPSASLIPHDPTVLFTIAGMVPFKPYFTGEESPPWPRATSVQKCFRTPDLDIIGTTERHCTFFEMLGNFSFGDYFKADAIPMAWELWTEVLGIDPDRLWVTVHESDDEARQIWLDAARLPRAAHPGPGARTTSGRWATAAPGRADRRRSCSSIVAPPTGPTVGPPMAARSGSSRSTTSCSCSTTSLPDGTLEDLPGKSIDTGAGLERNLPMLQGVGVAVRDRRLPTRPGRGRGHHRGPLRRRSAFRRVVAHPRRPRPGHGHGGGRRRACRRTRAGATCCAGSSAGRCAAPSSWAWSRPSRRALVACGGRRARRRLSRARHRARPHLRDRRARGGGLPAHPRLGLGDPRGGVARRDGPGLG